MVASQNGCSNSTNTILNPTSRTGILIEKRHVKLTFFTNPSFLPSWQNLIPQEQEEQWFKIWFWITKYRLIEDLSTEKRLYQDFFTFRNGNLKNKNPLFSQSSINFNSVLVGLSYYLENPSIRNDFLAISINQKFWVEKGRKSFWL